jgi:hypothetical protein
VSTILRKGRAWAPVLKAAVLFVLPLPLVIAFVVALVTGEFFRFVGISGALTAFFGAGVLTWLALAAEARYFLGDRMDVPVVPFRLISTFLTATGAL